MIDIIDLDIEYSFTSGLGSIEEHKYIKNVQSKLYRGGYLQDKDNELIGITEFTILSLDRAKEDGFDIEQIFDHTEHTYRWGGRFYDFKVGDFKQPFHSFYVNDLMCENVCFIERMCLKPLYRGEHLAPKMFKDLVLNFNCQASIFVIEPYPLQFDQSAERDGLIDTFELNMLAESKAAGVHKLCELYQSWGFEKIPGIEDILFFNAELKNEKFDAISLED